LKVSTKETGEECYVAEDLGCHHSVVELDLFHHEICFLCAVSLVFLCIIFHF